MLSPSTSTICALCIIYVAISHPADSLSIHDCYKSQEVFYQLLPTLYGLLLPTHQSSSKPFNFLALGLPKPHHIRGTTGWRVSCSFYPLLSPSMPTLPYRWLTYHHFPAAHLSSHRLIFNLESWLPVVSLILKLIMKVGFYITYSKPTIKHFPFIITIIYRKLIDKISCKINIKSKLDLF